MGTLEETAEALFPAAKIAETTAPGKFPDVDAIRQMQQEKVREKVGDLPAEDLIDSENEVDEPDKVPAVYGDYDLGTVSDADPHLSEEFRKAFHENNLTKRQAAQLATKYQSLLEQQQRKELARYSAEMERLESVCSSWDRETGFDRNSRIDPAQVDKVLPGFSSWIRAEALQGSVMLARLVKIATEGQGIKPSATKTDFSRVAEKLYPRSK